jgi:hypothetical protein
VSGAGARVDRDALTVAMAIVPGFLSRNKHHAVYADADVRRARARAWAIRGAVRQLAHPTVSDVVFERTQDGAQLSYRVEGVRLARRMELGRVEAACLAYLAVRTGVRCIHASEHDRAEVEAAVRRLEGGAFAAAIADPSLP